MKLRDLQYLVAIDEHRHFHKAAEACFVSQPTLSGQLRKLEHELGIQLIERTSRHVQMTAAGHAVAEQARKVLAEVRAIDEIAQMHADPEAGEIHLGLIPTIGPYLLPHVMAAIRKAFPRLRLWLHEYQTAVLLERLRAGELDVLVLALPAPVDDLDTLPLYREPYRLAVPRKSRLARCDSVTLADLRDHELLLLEEGHCLRDHVLNVCLGSGIREQGGFHASSLETLRHMVGEDMGITLMPELAIPERPKRADLVRYVPFVEPKPTRQVSMVLRKHHYRRDLMARIAEVMCEALPVRVYF